MLFFLIGIESETGDRIVGLVEGSLDAAEEACTSWDHFYCKIRIGSEPGPKYFPMRVD